MEDERRKAPRIHMRALVEVRIGGGPPHRTHTINVSTGGMRFELSEKPAEGAPFVASLSVSDGQPLEVRGVIRHVIPILSQDSFGVAAQILVGAEFVGLDERTCALIAAAIEEDD